MMRLASCRDQRVTSQSSGIEREAQRPFEPLDARPPASCSQRLGSHRSPFTPHSLLLSSCLLLAACGTQAPKPVVDANNDAAVRKPAPEVSPATPRRGGYYLDDGPEDNPPGGLDDVADAEPRLEPLHRFANRPYSVFGKDYFPATGLRPYRARGRASWYGKRFHGSKTSSGEVYDMYAMTAAHPTLPIPSYARVTNVSSGRSVVVRINDRGPFHADRLIDLSYVAARRLGYLNEGSTTVEVESIIPDESSVAQRWPPRLDAMHERASGAPASAPQQAKPTVAAASQDERYQAASDDPIASFAASSAGEAAGIAPSPGPAAPPPGVYVQLGAFSNNIKAESFRARVLRDLAWLREKMLIVLSNGTFRLHVGPYPSAQEAGRIAERVKSVLDLTPLLIQR